MKGWPGYMDVRDNKGCNNMERRLGGSDAKFLFIVRSNKLLCCCAVGCAVTGVVRDVLTLTLDIVRSSYYML